MSPRLQTADFCDKTTLNRLQTQSLQVEHLTTWPTWALKLSADCFWVCPVGGGQRQAVAVRNKKMTASWRPYRFSCGHYSPDSLLLHQTNQTQTELPAPTGRPDQATHTHTHNTKRAYLHSEWVCASKSQVPAESRASLSCIAAFCTDSPFSIGPSRGRAHAAGASLRARHRWFLF